MNASGATRIALAAGGTGGHMVPAHVLAGELRERGHEVLLLTDRRGAAVPGLFEDVRTHILESGRMTGNAMMKLGASVRILMNTRRARRILKDEAPAALVGFGGYPSLAAGLAATAIGVPLCLHEQNAVLGRANRLLAKTCRALALSWTGTARVPGDAVSRAVVTGNPVRETVARLADAGYAAPEAAGPIHLLVVGGSLGARILSDVVPDALALLPPALRSRLRVTQQCRREDLERVLARYRTADIDGELAPYFTDLPERLGNCHLAIARAGASTIAELATAGRPAILVPLAIATDDHQSANARVLAEAGAAWIMPEDGFDARALAKRLHRLLADSEGLCSAAAAARRLGSADAASRLADLVERIAGVAATSPARRSGKNESASASDASSGSSSRVRNWSPFETGPWPSSGRTEQTGPFGLSLSKSEQGRPPFETGPWPSSGPTEKSKPVRPEPVEGRAAGNAPFVSCSSKGEWDDRTTMFALAGEVPA
ncbi:MAG: undecaprenyldiphospho-muramoylpentapeptide beta-N-acetylglucosaminyltransferase [Alphaproteobacteria bacterium]|nr:MAG: undecaprenyldiphospho-muramoylpentapeptide beta-N-acetylglucosaminyltransferase [Alphaproteobacteria bacterium]